MTKKRKKLARIYIEDGIEYIIEEKYDGRTRDINDKRYGYSYSIRKKSHAKKDLERIEKRSKYGYEAKMTKGSFRGRIIYRTWIRKKL